MRHADLLITLRHYQQPIPSEVKSAANALEADLLGQQKKREAKLRAEIADPRPV
jgi:hypothetical protein